MRRSSQKRILILFLFTLVLGAVAVFIGLQLQRQQVSPDESSASTLGECDYSQACQCAGGAWGTQVCPGVFNAQNVCVWQVGSNPTCTTCNCGQLECAGGLQSCNSKPCCEGYVCQGTTGNMVCQAQQDGGCNTGGARCGGSQGWIGFRCNTCGECLSNPATFNTKEAARAYTQGCGQIDEVWVGGPCNRQLCGHFEIVCESCNGGDTPPPPGDPTSTPTPTPESTPTPTPTPPPGVTLTPSCGDSRCNPGETCEVGNQIRCTGGGIFSPGECRADCTYCGDGVIQANYGEQCDDGNTNNYDSCNNECQQIINVSQPFCGDGILQPGEMCDPGIPNSCGSGADCHPIDCNCIPRLPGLCGSACSSDADCPWDNTCYNGRCMLRECAPTFQPLYSGLISSPFSGEYYRQNRSARACTPDGCHFLDCGDACGLDGSCPSFTTCHNGICILPYCVDNECDDPCILPETSINQERIPIILLSIALLMLGFIIYRVDLMKNLWLGFVNSGGDKYIAWFSAKYKSIVGKRLSKKSRDRFEDKFNK